jgi:hypothetical protein
MRKHRDDGLYLNRVQVKIVLDCLQVEEKFLSDLIRKKELERAYTRGVLEGMKKDAVMANTKGDEDE